MPTPTVLLTGANGFIGRHLHACLRDLYRVLAPTHRELDLTQSDAVQAYLAAQRPDVIVHGANFEPPPGGPSEAMVATNLRMFFALAAAISPRTRMIHLGSGAEYDKRRPLVQVAEEAFGERLPADPYGFYKYVAARYIEAADRIVNLRLFGVYGPGEDYRYKFISNAVVKNLLGHDLVVQQNVRFSYLWVEDLGPIVAHFIRADVPACRSYNVVPDEAVDLVAVCRLVNQQAAVPSHIRVLVEGWKNEYTAANRRLRQAVPGLRFSSAAEGIGKLFAYYRPHLDLIDRAAVERDDYVARVSAAAAGHH